jgi:3-oxoacyl-[acyl-carrier-protein] synthase II
MIGSHSNIPIAVTGIGVVTAIGIGWPAFWEAALAGRSGFSRVRLFDTSAYKTHVAAEVQDFGPGPHLSVEEAAVLGKQAQMALVTARMAVADAGIDLKGEDPERIACGIGLLVGEPVFHQTVLESWDGLRSDTAPTPEPYGYPWQNPSAVISKAMGLAGPCQSLFCACASGNYAIAWACDLIRQGKAGIVLAGGAEEFNQATFTSFHEWRSMAPDQCKPFSADRKGLIVGEGAAVLVLEPLEAAVRAGRPIHAQVVGYGLSCDAHHLTAPHPKGRGADQAIRRALRDAGLVPEKIDYVSAHGTGTEVNDRIETAVLKKVFGDHSRKLLISSIKSMIGHPMGAASAIEAVVCCLAVKSGCVPPTMNLVTPDPACDLNYVPNRATAAPVHYAMNNAFGFGGINGVVLFGCGDGDRHE